MNEAVAMILSAPLVAIGIGAEVYLILAFLRESADERADRRPRAGRTLWAARRARMARTQRGRGGSERAMALACAVGMGGVCGAALAQATDPGATSSPESAAEATAVAPVSGSAISVQINLDYTTAYFYRGIVQEDSGLIIQPAARLTANVVESDGFKLDAFAGTWNSFHGQKTGADTDGDFTEYWYESDLYGGLTLSAGKISLTTSYTFLTSPSDAYETVQELGFSLALDDSEWLRAWAMKPYATVAIETGADASDGADSDTGTYLELGIGPGFSFDVGSTPVTMVFSVAVGLSLSDYYQDAEGDDDAFGFAQAGVRASMPLGKPGRLGTWTLNAGVYVLFLGDHTSDYNGGEDTEVIGTVGLQWNF